MTGEMVETTNHWKTTNITQMNKYRFLLRSFLTERALTAILLVLFMASCIKSGNDSALEKYSSLDNVKEVSFTVPLFNDGDALTKTQIGHDGSSFLWSVNDTVGIYPNTGSQIYFAMTAGAGASSAQFDGGGWDLKASAVYYSYYPFIGNIYLDRTHIPVSFAGQKQRGINTTSHIGPFDFMCTDPTSSESGMLSFNYHHLCAMIAVKATLPAGNYTKLAITAPTEAFTSTGYYSLLASTPAIEATTQTNQLLIDLENISFAEQTEFTVYLMTAPVNLNGVEITISVLNDNNTEFQCKKTPSREYKAGSRYGLTCSSFTEVPSSSGLIPVETVPATSIILSDTTALLNVGDTFALTATLMPNNASDKTVTWTSSDESTATVTYGIVTAVKIGTATITAKTGDVSATCLVSVIAGHEYVDLGLPSGVKWATSNIGAAKPEDAGDFFAWGETEPKTDYSWSTYKYCKGTETSMTKYCFSSANGRVDNKISLDKEDDVAHIIWGSRWRMPTKDELGELVDNCTWTWTTQNNVKGYRVTGPNNKSIFLPITGYMNGTGLAGATTSGYYWSSSIDTSGVHGRRLTFNSSHMNYNRAHRYYGFPVRPVYGDYIPVSSLTLNQTSVSLKIGDTVTLKATVNPSNASDKTIIWTSSDTTVATVNNGVVTAIGVGSATITAFAGDKYATCSVIVEAVPVTSVTLNKNSVSLEIGETVTLKATVAPSNATDKTVIWTSSDTTVATVNNGKVGARSGGTATITALAGDKTATCTINVSNVVSNDLAFLGLSVYWAKCNLGASSAKEYGNYYAFGETETKTEYTKSNYKWRNGYNKVTLAPEDDAAHMKLGGSWRVPTLIEVYELLNNCTIQETTQGGVKGRSLTSKKTGFSIFFPYPGRKQEGSHYWAGERGYYRANRSYFDFSTANSGSAPDFTGLTYASGGALGIGYPGSEPCGDDGWYGLTIRPVFDTGQAFDSPENPADGIIDLGLSVKWRSCNLGAEKPEESGDYYQWAATKDMSTYPNILNWAGYPYAEVREDKYFTLEKITKYNGEGKEVLESCDDAAATILGGSWRIPTVSEWNELLNNCIWSYTIINGVGGFKVQSKVSGFTDKWIFLPAAGFVAYQDGGRLVISQAGYKAEYWSSQVVRNIYQKAKTLNANYFSQGLYDNTSRNNGLPIRPVTSD